MKYLLLPVHLLKFWYIESLTFFVLTWKNLMLFLEEDLAVTLMWRLIFVPLFHDSSVVGRILSFLFRFFRILLGLFAFTIVSLIFLAIVFYWFCLPVLAGLDIAPHFLNKGLFFGGVGLFLIHIIAHPHNKVWSTNDLWSASTVKKE